MKRLLSIFLFFVIALTIGACSSQKIDSMDLLTAVLNNEKTFITEKGEAVLLKNYAVGNGEFTTPLYANPVEYGFVDFDEDKTDEMVINISTDYGAYLVLHCNGLDVYGYEFGVRSLQALKTDGSFMGSNGAASNYYCRLTFEDNKASVTYTAIKDSTMNQFELNGKECSIEELNEYINDWNLKTAVKWIKLKYNSEDTSKDPTNDNTGNNDDSTSTNISAKINLNNYVSVEFEGDNLAGYGSVTFDKERFLLDHIGSVSFNKESIQVYRELYGNTDKSAANAILNYISVSLDKRNKLSNGDTVKTVWKIDTEKVETYFVWDYVCTSESFTVSGLKDADTFDPFERLEVSFSGISPYGTASAYNYGNDYSGTYKVTPNNNLKNGDKVTVTYSCSDKATMVANYGKYPSSFEKTYTVSGLNTYVRSMTELTTEQQNKLISDARAKIWVLGYGNYTDAKYCGDYFYTAKGKEVHGVHFLSWCGTPVGNAVCFVFEHPEEIGVANSPNVYTVIALENLLINEQGELVYNRHDMSQMSNRYESNESLKNAYVGVFDEIMHCSNNVKFN